MESEINSLENRLSALEARLRADPVLAGELFASRAEFFQGRVNDAAVDRDAAARRRHLEWFLFERVSPAWDHLGIEFVLEHLGGDAGFQDDLERHALVHSFAGIFEIASRTDDGALWLAELSSQGQFPIAPSAASADWAEGDLLAGRLFPLADGSYRLSPATVRFQNAPLVEALQHDLERARAARRGIVRISQLELERMFFASGASGAPEDPVGEARALLVNAGVEKDEVEGWLEDLADTPFPEQKLRIGVDDALGPILDRLAFDSELDLDAARRALLFAWEDLRLRGAGRGASLTPAAPPPRAPAGTPDVARALAQFEERRKSGAPLDQVFDQLEAELQVADVETDTDEDEVELGGVVEAVVAEFLWEVGETEGPERARALEKIQSFGRFAQHVSVFENLSERDLLSYAAWWLPESGELANADEARSALAALGGFCQWADETQEIELRPKYDAIIGGLTSSLPRVVEANRRRTRSTSPTEGELFEVLEIAPQGVKLRDRRGALHDAQLEADLTTWLRNGDRVRAQLHADRRLAVYCCYPPEARGLEGSAS
ncbi:MAG: hypothetical protein JNL28_13460 [Planctomycetes bacterium]|nr:hypothetical protein [Planctomycetota bacterium]